MKKNTLLLKTFVFTFVAIFCAIVVRAQFQPAEEELTAASNVSGPGPYAYANPDVSSIQSVQNGGKETCVSGKCVTSGGRAWSSLLVGHVGNNKRVEESHKVRVSNLPGDEYGVIESNVTVSRLDYSDNVMQKIEGKALVVTDMDEEANAGYILVNRAQAETWIKVLNGNPSYVFGGSRILTYNVENLSTGESYKAYNLAEIANQSGGAGDPPPGDGLTRLRSDLYHKRDGLVATPRPTREVALVPPSSAPKASFLRSFAAPKAEEPEPPEEPEIVFLPSRLGLTLVSREDADQFQKEWKALSKVEYRNEQGEPVNVELVMILSEDRPDRAALIVVDDAAQLVYAPVAFDVSEEKPEGIIRVGPEIGKITRAEGKRRFFQLHAETQKVKVQPEHSFTVY